MGSNPAERSPTDGTESVLRGHVPETTAPGDLPPEPHSSYDPGRSRLTLDSHGHEESHATTSLRPEGADAAEVGPALEGGFTIGTMIARGGMGEVWRAEQRSLSREVAVKRLREKYYAPARGKDAIAQAERLFRVEAVTTALLEHPNIVPVYDLGRDEAGRPLLAMKLVKGVPWSQKLRSDRGALPRREFLARHLGHLIQVAQAVAFAHSRGIVHRDLKPSQVMLGDFGEVLLMDWGLAVVHGTEHEGGEAGPELLPPFLPRGETASSPSGTPAYMAPEQTESKATRVGTWTDIYLLGGILYELLTGTPPHEANSSRAAFARAAASVVEPPSVRAPGEEIPRDLEAVAMRALSNDPVDRHANAGEFIAALEAHLGGASRREQSRAMTAEAGRRLEDGPPGYAAFSEISVKLNDARALWPENPDAQRLLLECARRFGNRALAAGDLGLARLQAGLLPESAARTELERGIAGAEQDHRRAISQRRIAISVAAALCLALAGGVWGHLAEQRRAAERLRAANAQLTEQNARAVRAREDAEGLITFMLGDLQPRLVPIGQLGILNEVGDRALGYFESLPPTEATEGTQANHALALRQIGAVRREQGNYTGALEALTASQRVVDAALAAEPGNRSWLEERARNFLEISSVNHGQADLARAEENARAAQSIARDLAASGTNPAAVELLVLLARCTEAVGNVLLGRGDVSGAAGEFADHLATSERLLQGEGGRASRLVRLHSLSLTNVAYVARLRGALPDALAKYREALGELEQIAVAEPADMSIKNDINVTCDRIGSISMSLGQYGVALEHYLRALSAVGEMVEHDPTNTMWKRGRTVAFVRVGTVREAQGDYEGALSDYTRALEAAADLMRSSPGNGQGRNLAAWAKSNMGSALLALGRREEALAVLHEVVEERRDILRLGKENWWWESDLAVALHDEGRALLELGRTTEAAALFEEAVSIVEPLAARQPENAFWQNLLAVTLLMRGEAAAAAGGDGSTFVERAREIALRTSQTTGDAQHRLTLARAELASGNVRGAANILRELRAGGMLGRDLDALEARLKEAE